MLAALAVGARVGWRIAHAVVVAGALLAVPPSVAAGPALAVPPPNPWATTTLSPRVGLAGDAADAALVKACGGGVDASLVTVASEVAAALAAHGELPDAQEVEWRQHKAGNPHPWARTWGARKAGAPLDRAALALDVKKWLGASAPSARCGVATARIGSGTGAIEALAVIAVEPFADLAPLPTQVALGAWLDVDATMLRDGTDARVIVLPPSGAPRSVLSTTDDAEPPHVRAKALLGAPGRWIVQVVASDAGGPRPVLEAELWVGVEPPLVPPSSAAPGESLGDGVEAPGDALFLRLQGARAAEGVAPLAHDPTLDAIAAAHAVAMRKAHKLAHDVGDGDPAERVAATGTAWKLLGEDVAKAKTERAVHRALYASPSHRANMLDRRFRKVGIGVALDAASGELWVAEEFGAD